MAKKMKYLLIAACSLFACGRLLAIFSAFEIITPGTEQEDFHPIVSYEKTIEGKNRVRISQVKNHAWLIIRSEPAGDEEKEFRALVWSLTTNEKYLKDSWGMNPNMESVEMISPIAATEGEIEIYLSDDLASRTYIAIDFAYPVDDGGFYYTIDIPKFHQYEGAIKAE
jgi:hypothetical protein